VKVFRPFGLSQLSCPACRPMAHHVSVQPIVFYFYGFSSVTAILVGVRMHGPAKPGPWLASRLRPAYVLI
jgi:hypothetical protein